MIRTVTLGMGLKSLETRGAVRRVAGFFNRVEEEVSSAGFGLRTRRLLLPHLPWHSSRDRQDSLAVIDRTSEFCSEIGIRWFCAPFRIGDTDTAGLTRLGVRVLSRHSNAFVNMDFTDHAGARAKTFLQAADFIRAVSVLSPDGIENFRCGVSFHCGAGGPFFPFSHHAGRNGFSLAPEALPPLVETAESEGRPPETLLPRLGNRLAAFAARLQRTGLAVEAATGMEFKGLDMALAPHPEDPRNSVAHLIECIGAERFGGRGTAFLTSCLTNLVGRSIQAGGVRPIGFNGVMYSVLEDPRLSFLNAEGPGLSLDALLAYSTLCACGIDMVPLPGDVSRSVLASILLDVAAVSRRYQKPLGVRLLPIPGKKAGELTSFEHDFLCNTRILSPGGAAIQSSFLSRCRVP